MFHEALKGRRLEKERLNLLRKRWVQAGCSVVALFVVFFAWGIYLVVSGEKIEEEFHNYAEIGDMQGIDQLLKKGYVVDYCPGEDDETALWVAASTDNVRCVNYLLAHGASVNHKDYYSNSTPLTRAYNPQIIEALITHGADPNAVSKYSKTTALHLCAKQVAFAFTRA